MMPSQLTLTSLLERAGTVFRNVEIASQRPDNSTHRYTSELPHTSTGKILKSALREEYPAWVIA